VRRREFLTLLGGGGSSVAARGTGAATGDAGDRMAQQLITRGCACKGRSRMAARLVD